jgi:hypothetical protein
MNRYTTEVTKLIQTGIESGDFRDDLNAEKTAYYIAALMQGLVMRWSVFNFNFDLEQEADDVWDFIENSLRNNRK